MRNYQYCIGRIYNVDDNVIFSKDEIIYSLFNKIKL